MLSKEDQNSQLFLVRCWSEEVREIGEVKNHRVWRGRVQQVLSGESYTFQDWPSLINLLLEMAETEKVGAKAPESRTEEVIK